MSEESSLTIIEQQRVDFYGDDIPAAMVDGGRVYVPIRPLCDFLGISWSTQRGRINRDAVLSGVARGVLMNTPGGRQTLICLPLDYLNGWLFGINANRVREDLRDKVLRYQRDCYQVLSAAFSRPAGETTQAATLLQVREMGRAIMQMAEEQLVFDRRLTTTEDRLDQAAVVVGDMSQRLETVEQRLAPGEPVTQEQASQISQAVKAVVIVLGKQSGRSEFASTYGEMYRKYGITSYKLLPAERFGEVMKWLSDWY